jgi:hypothetical protein
MTLNNFIIQKFEIGNWFSHLKSIESTARGSCETYKEAELSFIESEKELKTCIQNKQTNLIKKKIEKKENAEERLLKLGRELLLEKDKYLRVIFKVKKEIHQKSKKIGIFSKDIAMKNFIYQVNNLKNREYDLNQIIDEFNKGWDKKENPDQSLDLSKLDGPVQQHIISQQYRSLPLSLNIPEIEFFTFLETEFYKSIHHNLLSEKHYIEGNNRQMVSYSSFGRECVYLSKLLDELALDKKEKIVLINLAKKDEKGFFVDKFLESFLRYKKFNFKLHALPMYFFISKIIQPLFIRLSEQKKYTRIYNILLKIQTIKVRKSIQISGKSKSMIISNSKANSLQSSQIISGSKSEELNSNFLNFRQWMSSLDQDILKGSLNSKEFWILALSKIFNNYSNHSSTIDSSLLEKSLISATSLKTFHTEADTNKNLSFFERIKKSGQKLMKLHPEEEDENSMNKFQESQSIEAKSNEMKSLSKDSVSEINREIIKEMIIRNLLSCKPFLSSNEAFQEILEFLDEKLHGFDVKGMWSSLSITTYFETEVQKLRLICYERQSLKTLKISKLIQQISIFDN